MKQKTPRDKSYLALVRALPCVVTGQAPSEPHHIIGEGEGGMGMTASDYYTMPLCREEHRRLHDDPKAWEEQHGSQWRHVARTMIKIFEGIES